MEWKINRREPCVHSALSGETRSDGGWTQSPVAAAAIGPSHEVLRPAGKLHWATLVLSRDPHSSGRTIMAFFWF